MSAVVRHPGPQLIRSTVAARARRGAHAWVGGSRARGARSARPSSTPTLAPGRHPAGRARATGPGPRSPTPTASASSATSTASSTRGRGGASPGKCQVFIAPEDDHLRTRLTHAVEVAQVATGIARAANLCLPLVEAIALAHDCGHGPAGHASEEAFSPFLPGTGYDHAVYGADVTLAPLNLCAETLDGVRNHSWRRPAPRTPEGEVVALGRPHRVRVPRLRGRRARRDPRARRPARPRCATSSARRPSEQIGTFVLAVLDAVERTGSVGMTEPAASALAAFRAFNFERIYLRPAARRQAERVIRLLGDLVDHFADAPRRIPFVRDGEVPAPLGGVGRGGGAGGALRERHDRPVRARPRGRAPRLAPRRPAPRRLRTRRGGVGTLIGCPAWKVSVGGSPRVSARRWGSSTRTSRGSATRPTSSRSRASTWR